MMPATSPSRRPLGARVAVLTVVFATLGGCLPGPGGGGAPGGGPSPGPGPRERIGTFIVVYSPVSVKDSAGERAAKPGDPLYNDSKVTTGAGGGARIDITGYGTIDLDERTDPFFEKAREGGCVLLRILYGLVYATGHNFCVDLPPEGADFILNSSANIRVSGSAAVVTVVDGSARFRRAGLPTLGPGQQATLATGKAPQVVTLTPAQLRSLTAWRQRFQPIR
jgi:hypothetical protein